MSKRDSVPEQEVSAETFWEVIDETITALGEGGIAYLFTGGIPSAVHGYPVWSHGGEDIDLLVKPDEAAKALETLGAAGFETERTHPEWMYKARKHGVTVDLIFRPDGGIQLDDQTMAHKLVKEFKGRSLEMVGPEDLVLMLTASYEEDEPIRLKNLLGILTHSEIDWGYLVSRAGDTLTRLASFLVYADSKDIFIPREVLKAVISSSVRHSVAEGPSGTNRASQGHDRNGSHRAP